MRRIVATTPANTAAGMKILQYGAATVAGGRSAGDSFLVSVIIRKQQGIVGSGTA